MSNVIPFRAKGEGPVTFTVRSSDIERCPKRSILPAHYRANGSCLCVPDPAAPSFEEFVERDVLLFLTEVDGLGDLTEEEFWVKVAALHTTMGTWLAAQVASPPPATS